MKLTERLGDLRGISKVDVLSAIGLATRRSASQRIVGSLSVFGIGLLVGAGAALLLAPKTGMDLREDLTQRFRKLREEREGQGNSGVNSSLGSMASSVRDEIRT